jgi:hypothetical protein
MKKLGFNPNPNIPNFEAKTQIGFQVGFNQRYQLCDPTSPRTNLHHSPSQSMFGVQVRSNTQQTPITSLKATSASPATSLNQQHQFNVPPRKFVEGGGVTK